MNEVPPETAPKTPSGASAKSGRGEPLPQLPDAGIFQFTPIPAKPMPPAIGPAAVAAPPEHTSTSPAAQPKGSAIFDALVNGESDLVGFVAYGFYKQNKRDFLTVFEQTHARAPDATEIRAYMTGEATARRVSTYRHLAEGFLASYGEVRPGDDDRGAATAAAIGPERGASPRTLTQFLGRSVAARQRRGPTWLTAAYIAFLILLLAAMVVLIRGGFSPLGGFGR